MEDELELLDSQNEQESQPKEEEVVVEETEDNDKIQEANKKLYARLKKEQEARKAAEEQLKNLQSNNQVANQSISREEVILLAKGFSDEDLQMAQGIAKGFGIPLSKAVEHEMFTTYKGKKEAEAKANKAKLGASNSSGSRKDDSVRPGMSDEDHKELWKKIVS